MKKVFNVIFIFLLTIILFASNKVFAAVSNYDEAWDYVTNKDNGYCAYKTDNLVLGVKTKGIGKGYDTYVYHRTSGLITEKKVFSPQGYEKGSCPKYAQVQFGYIDESAIYGIMISDHTTTLGTNLGDFVVATQGYHFDTGTMDVQFDSSQEDGKPNTEPSQEVVDAYEKKKAEYKEKYNCLYADDANRIVFGNNGDTAYGSLYMGYDVITYDVVAVGETNWTCADYAQIVRGTYEDKEVYKVYVSEDKDKFKSLPGIDNIVVASEVISNLKSNPNADSEAFNSALPNITTCTGLLGEPDDEGSPAFYLVKAFDVIKYVAIVLLIVLSVMDFTGAVVKQDKDALAKILRKIMMRFILCIIIFFLPYFIKLLLHYLVERQTDLCGIGG